MRALFKECPRWGLLSILWLTIVPQVQAQQGISDSLDTLSVTTRVDQERITVGDPLQYAVTVVSPPGVEVTWPEKQSDFGDFEVLSLVHDGPYAAGNGGYADTLRYTLTVYAVGVHSIPPLVLPYTMQDGTVRTAYTDSVAVTVVSVIDDEATDIRDLKQPAEISETIPWYVWVGGAVLLLTLILGAVYLYRRRNRSDETGESSLAPPRLSHEIAYDELDQLARFQWLAQGKVTRHYTALSEIIRRYLSARYYIAAMEITTTELFELLKTLDIKPEHRQMIVDFLHECDLVKFAKYIPDEARQGRSIRDAREIVAATKVLPDPIAAPDPPASPSLTTNE